MLPFKAVAILDWLWDAVNLDSTFFLKPSLETPSKLAFRFVSLSFSQYYAHSESTAGMKKSFLEKKNLSEKPKQINFLLQCLS